MSKSGKALDNPNYRIFCLALSPSTREPLSKKHVEAQALDCYPSDSKKDAKERYSRSTAGDARRNSWLQQFVHPKKAFNPKKLDSALVANAVFDKIIAEDEAIHNPKESLGLKPTSTEKVHYLYGSVLQQKPQVDNLTSSGAGNGLHLDTDDERLFSTPFLEVTKAWLARQPYLLNSQDQYVNYLQDALMGPLLRLGYTVCTVSAFCSTFSAFMLGGKTWIAMLPA